MTIDDADSCWLLAIASSSASLSSDFKHCTDLKNLSVWSQSACDDRKEVTVTKEGVNREREREYPNFKLRRENVHRLQILIVAQSFARIALIARFVSPIWSKSGIVSVADVGDDAFTIRD